jgi:hypothetical protein
MAHKTPLALMRLGNVYDLGVLDQTPPPFSFEKDMNLAPPPPGPAAQNRSPHKMDFTSFFDQGGPP